MNIRIPSQTNPILNQTNDSSIFGTITESFNLDLTSDLGKIKTTKTLLSKSGVYQLATGAFGSSGFPCGGVATFSNNIYLINGENVWVGGNSPSDAIVIDTQTLTPTVTIQTGDIKTYNSKLWVTNSSSIFYSTGGAWTNLYSYGTGNQAHLFETQGSYLYFSFDNYKVGRIDTANTVSTTGTGTYNPNIPGYTISFLKSDGNKLWIGYLNTSGGSNETTLIVLWDGSSENVASAIYKIKSRGILAGAIVNGVPHVVDSNGRLLAFNGSFFQEIAKFPLKASENLYGLQANHDRSIHPNGMDYDPVNNDLLINVSNVKYFTGGVPTFFDFPGGVWSYKKETGLIHKYSPSLQPIADSGTTNLIDWGQFNIVFAGALNVLRLAATNNEKGRVLFGSTIATGSTIDVATTSITVTLCTNDTAETAQNVGQFVTTEIHSQSIIETWQKIYAMYQKLGSANDKIVVKYKTEKDSPTTASITWADIDRITTTTDVSNYQIGDEVKFIQGTGSGKSFTITSIVDNAGTYTVILSESVPSGVIGLTGIAQFEKWIKAGEITNTDTSQYKEMAVSLKNISPFLQVKVQMQFTGDNEMYGLFVISNSEIK